MANDTVIPSPNVNLVIPGTGNIDPTWYQFLTQIFKRTGSDAGSVTDVSALAPLSSTGGSTPELSIRSATSSLSGAMSAGDKAKLDQLTFSSSTWVPGISFDTPGNLAITYGTRVGNYTQVANRVSIDWAITTTAFTWSTATGALRITGIPIAANPLFPEYTGSLSWAGLTLAGTTDIAPQILAANTSIIRLQASGSGSGRVQLTTANTTSGTQLTLSGSMNFLV